MSPTPTTTTDPHPGAVPAARRPGVAAATRTILARELRPVVRDPFSLVFTLVQPLTFLVLFAPLLAASSGIPMAEALTWFVPAVLCMTTLFGTGMVGSNLLFEIQSGSHERTLVAPVPRSALLVGRALKEIVPLLGQAALLLAVAALMGYRPDPAGTVLGVALLAVFGVGLGSLSYALGIVSAGTDWMFWAVQQSLLFPLMLLSGMLLPLDGAPGWMRWLATTNPLTHLVDALRSLTAGDLLAADVGRGAVATTATLVVGLAVGLRAIRRGT